MDNTVYISLGTNQGDRENYLKQAIQLLESHPQIFITDYSSIYETDPVGYLDQPKFLNMVIQINTSLLPIELLNVLQDVEGKLGRKRTIRWGPRTIDLDILLYNKENIISERLIVPHPRMFDRAFVTVPLLELNEELLNVYSFNAEVSTDIQGLKMYRQRDESTFKVKR